jgi:hypothetical protein
MSRTCRHIPEAAQPKPYLSRHPAYLLRSGVLRRSEFRSNWNLERNLGTEGREASSEMLCLYVH